MDIESSIYRIITGHYFIIIDGKTYKVVSPRLSIKQEAHSVYMAVLQQYKFDNASWLTEKEKYTVLYKNELWNEAKEKELQAFSKRLEDMKIELYLKYLDIPMRKKIKSSIETGKREIQKMLNSKISLDHMTLESYATNIKNEHIISNTVYNMDGSKVFDKQNMDSDLLEIFIKEISENTIDMTTLREIARSDLWKSYWDAAKNNIFPPPAYEWTDEQRLLINLSKMYDSVREHPEAPDDDIINDDDALDGWILFNKRKAEKERKKSKVMDAIGGKYKNANEIFLVTNSEEESREVYSLNDPETMAQIKTMAVLAQEKGEVQWSELPHIKAELKNKMKQQSINNKGKR